MPRRDQPITNRQPDNPAIRESAANNPDTLGTQSALRQAPSDHQCDTGHGSPRHTPLNPRSREKANLLRRHQGTNGDYPSEIVVLYIAIIRYTVHLNT